MNSKPTVMFVCVHNAGRSQMAAGYLQHFAGDRIAVLSSGTMPADQLHPVVIEAMAEEGIDLSDRQPTVLTVDDVKASDVVITMGCGDACPIFPGKRYLDWALDDPARQPIERVREIRNEIRELVLGLIDEVAPAH
jgi:protein-tyrosine-phosphatase